MNRQKLETTISVCGGMLAAVGAALCIPSVRRRVADALEGPLERTSHLDGTEIAATAGTAVAKVAAMEGAKQAALSAKKQLLG